MPDVGTAAPEAPHEHPPAPLLRDPPPPPGYTDPVEQSEVLEQAFTAPDEV
jgi:hypothetical protein